MYSLMLSDVPDVRLDGEPSFVFLLQNDELGLADVASENVHLAVDGPRQFFLDRLRLAVGQGHLAAEPCVRLQYLAGRRQRQSHLHARRARLLHAHRARRPADIGQLQLWL